MLETIATLLTGLHVLGAAIGAGGATYAEIFYTKAMADGKIDRHEREWFDTTHWALQWGMLIALVSGILLIYVQYMLPDSPQNVLYAPLWMQNTLALSITLTAWLMARRALSWWMGSSIVFAGWWMMLILDAWQRVSVPYLTLVILYIFAVALSGGAWAYARILARKEAL